ncbi:hypothetical protein JHK86_050765 [Glycine max]|nr:hypothetical protein JHK86_050765 [Glycine max]
MVTPWNDCSSHRRHPRNLDNIRANAVAAGPVMIVLMEAVKRFEVCSTIVNCEGTECDLLH